MRRCSKGAESSRNFGSNEVCEWWMTVDDSGRHSWYVVCVYIIYIIYNYISIYIGSLVRKLPSYGRWSWLAFSQPHHHVNHPSSSSWEVLTVQKRVNSRVKALSGSKPCVFPGIVAPEVAEVGSAAVSGSIWESCQQKVHRTISYTTLQHVRARLIRWLDDSMIHCFIDALIRWIITVS